MMYWMSTTALRPAHPSDAPKLRLVPKRDHGRLGGRRRAASRDDRATGTVQYGPGSRLERDACARDACAHDAVAHDDSPVLIAGCDPFKRADVLASLSEVMPEHMLFEEAETFWEVLVRAPESRMVVLSGELDGVLAESLLHMLGHRHPGLPVVSLADESVPHADESVPDGIQAHG
jgi:hypothetical protein